MHITFPPVRALPVALAAWLFSACAGTGDPHVKQRPGREYAGRSLAVILPGPAEVEVKNPEDVAAAFPRDSAFSAPLVLAQEFAESFYAGLAPALDYVTPLRVPDSVPSAPTGRLVGDSLRLCLVPGNLHWSAPDSAWLTEHGVAADLVLKVGPLVAQAYYEDIIAPKFGGSLRVHYLMLEGGYLIWDYAASAMVARGRFRTRIEYRVKPGPRDWIKAFDKAVTEVGEASPFRGPKWFHR